MTNFAPRQIANFMSEVLTTGFADEQAPSYSRSPSGTCRTAQPCARPGRAARSAFKRFVADRSDRYERSEQPPTEAESLRTLVRRALNRNQLLILQAVDSGNKETCYALLKRLSAEHGIASSTLKLNARILRELGLISYGGAVRLTAAGAAVKDLAGVRDG